MAAKRIDGRPGLSAALGMALLLTAALAFAPPARADLRPDEDREETEVPDSAGRGDVPQEGMENPLPGIVELMRKVELSLVETDTERWTQAEQQRIVEALELGGEAVSELEKLIDKIEQMASQAQGGGGSSSGAQSSGERKPQPRPRGERKQDQGQKLDPGEQQQKPDGGQKEQSDERPAENDGRTSGQMDAEERGGQAPQRTASDAESWGNLPMKQAREVMESTQRKKPLKFREQLEAYFRRLAGSGD